MATYKDSQKQKVYDAEGRWRRADFNDSVDLYTARDILELLVDEFEVTPVTIEINRRIRQFGGWYKGWQSLIEVPSATVTMKTLLHEFSHHVQRVRQGGFAERKYRDPGHGYQFTEVMLEVVGAWFGEDARDALNAEYVIGKVNIGLAAAVEAEQKEHDRIVRVRAKDGEEKTGYVIKTSLREGAQWLTKGDWFTHSQWNASVYSTLGGAKRRAKEWPDSVIYSTVVRRSVDHYDGKSTWGVVDFDYLTPILVTDPMGDSFAAPPLEAYDA